MLKILSTGAGGSGAEAMARLWRDKYEMHFADADVDGIASTIAPDRRHAIPMAGAAWVDAMAGLCRTLAIDVLIPTVDEELSLIPELQGRVPELLVLAPQPGFVRLMKDKLQSMRALAAAGIDSPATQTIDQAGTIGFPCLVKPLDGRGSRGVQILQSPDEVAAYRVLARRPADQLLSQELLSGQEWTVYVSADRNGKLCSVVPVRVDIKRGITVRAATVQHDGIIEYCSRLHAKFPTSGPYNVQLMETKQGRLAAFEVNPRVSTTLCLAVAAGADPVADLMSEHRGGSLRPFTSGLRLRRFWFNDIEQG